MGRTWHDYRSRALALWCDDRPRTKQSKKRAEHGEILITAKRFVQRRGAYELSIVHCLDHEGRRGFAASVSSPNMNACILQVFLANEADDSAAYQAAGSSGHSFIEREMTTVKK